MPLCREALYWGAPFEVLLDNLGNVGLFEAQIPGALRVNDDVGTVLAQVEAVDGVDPDLAQ